MKLLNIPFSDRLEIQVVQIFYLVSYLPLSKPFCCKRNYVRLFSQRGHLLQRFPCTRENVRDRQDFHPSNKGRRSKCFTN